MTTPSVWKKDGKLVRRFNGAIARCACPCPDSVSACPCYSEIGFDPTDVALDTVTNIDRPLTDPGPADFSREVYGAWRYMTKTPGTYPITSGTPLGNGTRAVSGGGARPDVIDASGAISPVPCGFSSLLHWGADISNTAIPPGLLPLIASDTELVYRVSMKPNAGVCAWHIKVVSYPSLTFATDWGTAAPGLGQDFTVTIGTHTINIRVFM